VGKFASTPSECNLVNALCDDGYIHTSPYCHLSALFARFMRMAKKLSALISAFEKTPYSLAAIVCIAL